VDFPAVDRRKGMTNVRMFVFSHSGRDNIRLGKFFKADGEAWGERDEVPVLPLAARILSGTQWVDFPGTYTIIRLVASDRAMDVLASHHMSGVQWAEVSVGNRRYWAMQTRNALYVRLVKEPASVFNPIYEAHSNATVPEQDLILDKDTHKVLFSARLVSRVEAAGLTGCTFYPVNGLD